MLSIYRKSLIILIFIASMSAVLLGCGNISKETTTANKEQADTQSTRLYTDYRNHTVAIPITPKRIIFYGETFGDLNVLHTSTVGSAYTFYQGAVFEKEGQGGVDIGSPIDIEKVLSLEPDLIITGDTDDKAYAQLAKIAPTIMFDTFAPMEERLPALGDIINKKAEADAWIVQYEQKSKQLWQELHKTVLKPDETATVLTYYPGNRLFVMLRTGLSQMLYEEGAFKAPPAVQKLLNNGEGFSEISLEALSDYSADRIFILNPIDKEAQASTDKMMENEVWKQLPAVKNGHVYTIKMGESSSDANTREWLLTKLKTILQP
ncbi:ABC transporter substrate-binding protein [Paenibacillus kyungheensis]